MWPVKETSPWFCRSVSVQEVEVLITRTKIKTNMFQTSGSFEVEKGFLIICML